MGPMEWLGLEHLWWPLPSWFSWWARLLGPPMEVDRVRWPGGLLVVQLPGLPSRSWSWRTTTLGWNSTRGALGKQGESCQCRGRNNSHSCRLEQRSNHKGSWRLRRSDVSCSSPLVCRAWRWPYEPFFWFQAFKGYSWRWASRWLFWSYVSWHGPGGHRYWRRKIWHRGSQAYRQDTWRLRANKNWLVQLLYSVDRIVQQRAMVQVGVCDAAAAVQTRPS